MTLTTDAELVDDEGGRPLNRWRGAAPVSCRPVWLERFARQVLVTDLIAVTIVAVLATKFEFGGAKAIVRIDGKPAISLMAVSLITIPAWITLLACCRAYDRRALGIGTEEYRRVVVAATYLFALVAMVAYLGRVTLARGFVLGLIPLAMVLTAVGRMANRRWLRHQRRHGKAVWNVLVVGPRDEVSEVASHFDQARTAGYQVVAACVPGGDPTFEIPVSPDGRTIPVLGSTDQIREALAVCHADVLAVTGPGVLENRRLRSLAWELETSGVDLIVVPAVTDVAGPRIAIYPVNGLPILHVEQPQLSGPARLFKECFDRITAAVALTLFLPFFVVIGLTVKLTSPGPVFFRQTRVGKQGREFRIVKIRTMVKDAEEQLDLLLDWNESDGALFKIRDDPRVTRVGRWLRRTSIDELPQLFNVLRGQMSLVGPRPPLPNEVDQYGDDVMRRLLVKPGLTGLWQVSGRSDLRWEESVALDLYYVENWSPGFDLAILWKTANALVARRGAY